MITLSAALTKAFMNCLEELFSKLGYSIFIEVAQLAILSRYTANHTTAEQGETTSSLHFSLKSMAKFINETTNFKFYDI